MLRWRLLTPAGRPGALAAISIEADDAAQLDTWLARAGLAAAPGEAKLRPLLGVDEGLVLRASAREVILTPHGGAEIVRQVARRLEEEGVARAPEGPAPWPEAAGEIEARMLEALSRAPGTLAVEVLLEQGRRWAGEVGVGGAEAEGAGALEVPPEVAARLARLLHPPTVAIVGPANVGKSALLNRLARRAVSVVADEPGTTRDHVGVTIDCAGLIVRMLDAPGMRAHPGAIEAEAQNLAREAIASADLLLVCFDARAGPPPQPLDLPDGPQRLTLATRIDLGRPGWRADVATSAHTGEGLDALAAAIRDTLLPPADLAPTYPPYPTHPPHPPHPGRWRFWDLP